MPDVQDLCADSGSRAKRSASGTAQSCPSAAVTLGKRPIGIDHPTYFIVALRRITMRRATPDKARKRARMLLSSKTFARQNSWSHRGFRALQGQLMSLSGRKAFLRSIKMRWSHGIGHPVKRNAETCGIDYFSTPYDSKRWTCLIRL